MRQAIVTKFMGPTNHRGARVKAVCEAGAKITSWDHAKGVDGNHAAAAEALARFLGWSGRFVGGATPGTGYAFVWDDGDGFTIADPTIDNSRAPLSSSYPKDA